MCLRSETEPEEACGPVPGSDTAPQERRRVSDGLPGETRAPVIAQGRRASGQVVAWTAVGAVSEGGVRVARGGGLAGGGWGGGGAPDSAGLKTQVREDTGTGRGFPGSFMHRHTWSPGGPLSPHAPWFSLTHAFIHT